MTIFNNIAESSKHLKELETFNKNVFVEDEKHSQEYCNFILALALIWNDNKDLNLYFDFVHAAKPREKSSGKIAELSITSLWGEIAGHQIHLEKLLVALVHELFKLIRESNEILSSPSFKQMLSQVQRTNREAWGTIVEFANGKAESKTPFGKALLMIRHKIANHYEPKEIYKGYKTKFLEHDNIPFISRGYNMPEHRFYFADAAAQEYYRPFQEALPEKDYYTTLNLIRQSLNIALVGIVERFIQEHSAWKKYHD